MPLNNYVKNFLENKNSIAVDQPSNLRSGQLLFCNYMIVSGTPLGCPQTLLTSKVGN